MDVAVAFFDWVLIITSTYCLFRTYHRIVRLDHVSLGNYVLMVVWVFCCLPILLNYVIGMPTYDIVYWYKPFITPMEDPTVCIIYDVMILVAVWSLYFYCNSFQKGSGRKKAEAGVRWGGTFFESPYVTLIFVLLPYIYVLASGQASSFLTYGSFNTRGLQGNLSTVLTGLLLLSLIFFCNWFFRRKSLNGWYALLLILYTFTIVWLSGKRYMIALCGILYLYYFMERNPSEAVRRRLGRVLPIALLALLGFSAYYLVAVKPLADTSTASVYDMLRVDYGRDDVTKYVIYHELVLHDHILDYPGETFLSTFLIWVPRAIWPAKPYQHFQYLTSSILGLPIDRLPAGTTPCWYEMCIANFSWLGIVVAWILLVLFIRWSEKARFVSTRAILLVLLIVLLTQSIDAYTAFVLLFIAQYLVTKFLDSARSARTVRRRRV